MKRSANNSCRALVRSRTPFQGSNLFAEQCYAHGHAAERYIVYSYGYHWPLFIFVPSTALPQGTAPADADGIWFENKDRYSRSTTKHRSQAHPLCATVLLPVAAMKELAESGRVAHAIVLTASQ